MNDAEKKMIDETLNETDWNKIVSNMKAAKVKWPVIGGDMEIPPVWRVRLMAQELLTDAVEKKGAAVYPGLCANYDVEEGVLELMSAIPVTITYKKEVQE